MNAQQIEELVSLQRTFFETGTTLSLDFRLQSLKKLHDAIRRMEPQINAALQSDLGKSATETYMCETGMTLSELSYMRRHLRRFTKDRHVLTPLAQFPSDSFVVREPYGVALIMSPWNYPFMLLMEPLIGALAAGNCCILKPSAYSPATSAVIRELVSACFPREYVAVVEGGRAENQALLHQRFDYIFFTGGVTVGKEVMRAASEHLTPVTLELGGKSPCLVDATADLDVAARRLAFGKLLNCGQTCVAPDYLLIDRTVKDTFLERLQFHMTAMVGDALTNDGYVHMINQKHFDRVCSLILPQKVVFGGKADPQTLRIQPTIMDCVSPDDAVMQQEIFGPLLPVLPYDDIEDALSFIKNREHPLALYLFSSDKALQRRVLQSVPFGGGCINDTIIHLATSRMGFGGVGGSGMGSYHGKKSFDTFSHQKSIVKKSTLIDLPIRYAPYSPLKDRLLRIFLR